MRGTKAHCTAMFNRMDLGHWVDHGLPFSKVFSKRSATY